MFSNSSRQAQLAENTSSSTCKYCDKDAPLISEGPVKSEMRCWLVDVKLKRGSLAEIVALHRSALETRQCMLTICVWIK